MKIKFEELEASQKKQNIIPICGKPVKSADGTNAVIKYMTYRNDELNVTVTPEEVGTIEFSKDWKFMKQPDFLEWTKGPKGPYLRHTQSNVADPNNAEW